MPARNPDLHGMVPDHSSVVLILLDVINDFEFPGGERLLRRAVPMARRLARFRARAKRAGIPVIYVNDNYGRWQSDFRRLTAALPTGRRARQARRRPPGAGGRRLLRAEAEAFRLLLDDARRAPRLPERPTNCLRAHGPSPTRPEPKRNSVAGSGTGVMSRVSYRTRRPNIIGSGSRSPAACRRPAVARDALLS